jgi:hypothetical protein
MAAGGRVRILPDWGDPPRWQRTLATQAGDYRIFAGWRSDSVFFDTTGVLNNLQFTGGDFFAEKDVMRRCAIFKGRRSF